MANPLALRSAPTTQSGPPYGTEAWCSWRNTMMVRRDIEWVLDGKGGAYLRDREDWSREHRREISKAADKDRADWLWRQQHPIAG